MSEGDESQIDIKSLTEAARALGSAMEDDARRIDTRNQRLATGDEVLKRLDPAAMGTLRALGRETRPFNAHQQQDIRAAVSAVSKKPAPVDAPQEPQ